jgi:ABC-type transport system involved in Fe-S cluster assembly fused permease/ATPase subunit
MSTSESASKLYEVAKSVATGKKDIEISMSAVGAILAIGLHYNIMSSLGLRTHAGCGAVKSSAVQANLAKFLSYTLTISVTIPLTLMFQHQFRKDTAAWMTLFGVMGLIASSIVLNFTRKCDNAGKRTKQIAVSGLASYIAILIAGVFLLVKKPAKIV